MSWLDSELGMIMNEMGLLFLVALLISSIGFYRLVYFISIGYTFSIVAMSILVPIQYLENMWWGAVLQNIFLLVWGVRLGVYIIQREFRASYRTVQEEVDTVSARLPWLFRILIWIGVSCLYVLMFSPSLFALWQRPEVTSGGFYVVSILGLFLMGGGLVLESVADRQKSNFKAHYPKRYCDVGLYQWVRCPNYLGEIVFWVGSWVIGLSFYDSPLKWLASVIGVVCIVLIMVGSTKRLEEKQGERYGQLSEYQTYIQTVPVLFPFVPLYSVRNLPAL